MACWLNDVRQQGAQATPEKKQRVKDALARLERALSAGTVKVVIDRASGAVAFRGLWRSDGVADSCAYRALTAANSAPLRASLARAEIMAGRSVNERAIASGVHSHDGGRSFGPGHSH